MAWSSPYRRMPTDQPGHRRSRMPSTITPRPGPIKPLIYAKPANGITDSQHHVFRADGATYAGPPTEKNESDRIEWIPLSEVRGMIDRREIVSSGSLVGLLYLLMDEAIR